MLYHNNDNLFIFGLCSIMKYKTTFLPALGFSFISCLAWGDDMTVLETIKVRAEASSEHDVQTNTAATKFSHDVLDVPFNRAFIDSEMLKQQDAQRIDDALTSVSGVFHQNLSLIHI